MINVGQIFKRLAVGSTVIGLCVLSAASMTPAVTQQPETERDRGIRMLDKGDADGAVKVLTEVVKRDKKDVTALHYLGVALEQTGQRAAAADSHERSAQRLYEFLIKKSFKDLDRLLDFVAANRQAIESGYASVRHFPELRAKFDVSTAQRWQVIANALREYANLLITVTSTEEKAYRVEEVTQKVKILSKPQPNFPEEEMVKGVGGNVRVAIVLRADGTIGSAIPLDRPSEAFVLASVAAARRIQFVPAQKDGKAVSQILIAEYGFGISMY
jgi:hypothetical protein